VPSSERAPIDWVALRGWYEASCEVLAIFDRCCTSARQLLTGGPAANLRQAARLGSLVAEADTWLVRYPCPHESNGSWVASIARLFAVIGDVITGRRGHGVPDNAELRSMILGACDSVGEFRGLVVRVGNAPPH